MKYVDYKASVLGKRVRKERYGYQCIGLFKDYSLQVYGIHFAKTGSAVQVRRNTFKIFSPQWTRIIGTSDLRQGDVIISRYGRFGHIAIFDHNENGLIYVLEQNGVGGGTGRGGNAIRVRGYKPSFWLGVWRYM